MTAGPAPGAQVHPQLWVCSAYVDVRAGLELVDGVLDDDVRAFVETDMTEIDKQRNSRSRSIVGRDDVARGVVETELVDRALEGRVEFDSPDSPFFQTLEIE